MVRSSRSLVALAVTAGALTAPAAASAARFTPLHRATPHARAVAAKSAKAKLPVVTGVAPKHLTVGGTLRISGRNFLVGRGKNTVVFQRSGGRYVFVKSGLSTSRKMWVKLPKRLQRFLTRRGSARKPTRFRIRILAHRFAADFTSRRLSPVVRPAAVKRHSGGKPTGGGGSGGGSGPSSNPTCDSTGKTLPGSGDADNDGLTTTLELTIHTDPCLADTDGDRLSDFWEYKSALNYNTSALPYPGKQPYTNPLDPSDANVDHDGDGLTAADEEAAWAKWGNKDITKPLFLSDGTQSSMGVVTILPSDPRAFLDNGDGILTDDERDSDLGDPTGKVGDGLGNWDEAHGPMNPAWWPAIFVQEVPYGLSRYEQSNWLDPDTDGDGVLDGNDDSDHDGYLNKAEVTRETYWTQPFNPCLPDPTSPTCSLHHPLPDVSWPPFDRNMSALQPPYLMALVPPKGTGIATP